MSIKFDRIALAIGTVLAGVALPPREASLVREIVDELEKAKEPTPVKIKASDIEKAVAAVLPTVLKDVVTEAVVEALALEAAKNASEKTE